MLGETPYATFADQILKSGWIRPNKRIFNNAKVSDHFAIIPTSLAPKHLNEMESKMYDMVTKRFLAVFYPAAEFMVTTRITRVEGEPFKTEGKVLVNPGWLAVYGKEAQTDDTPTLAPVQANETVKTINIEVQANQTKPPPRFTEATLLSAMEGAGKLVEDEELREAMREKGLGTPATRAQTIEGLIWEKYVLRQGRELQPTAKAFSLIALLRGLEIPELSSPELTGDWEFKLLSMARGQMRRSDFMQEIAKMTREIVAKAKRQESDTVPGDFGTLKVPCPKCGGEIHENYKKFQCQKCAFSLWKIMAGRQLEIPEAEELISKRQVGPLQGFRSKAGRPFAAVIKLTPEPPRRLISPARNRWASVRNAAAVSSRPRCITSAKRPPAARVRANSGPAKSSCNRPSTAPKCESSWRLARRTCFPDSSPRRGDRSRHSWWSRMAAWALNLSRARAKRKAAPANPRSRWHRRQRLTSRARILSANVPSAGRRYSRLRTASFANNLSRSSAPAGSRLIRSFCSSRSAEPRRRGS
jgi:hypothetical protein